LKAKNYLSTSKKDLTLGFSPCKGGRREIELDLKGAKKLSMKDQKDELIKVLK
jgi:hypothetical protein